MVRSQLLRSAVPLLVAPGIAHGQAGSTARATVQGNARRRDKVAQAAVAFLHKTFGQ